MSNEKEEKTQRYTDKIIEVAYYNFPLVPPKYTVNKAVYALLEEYKQSDTTVDLTELRKAFREWYVNNKDVFTAYSSIFNWFAPHIQPKQDKESDAIEFAEWCAINYWLYIPQIDKWKNCSSGEISTSVELYNQFQNKQ